jgi:hypothetical protein
MPRLRGAVALLLMALPVTTACMPDVPASPTYTKDVQPILAAHCVRCHGANGMLHTMHVFGRDLSPTTCYLQQYDDAGDCSVASTCQRGAGYCAAMFPIYINGTVDTATLMPPPPSELNQWEKDVLLRWASEKPPAQ